MLEKVFGYRQNGFLIKEGDEFVGGVPLFKVGNFLGGGYYSSSPFRDRGGIIYNNPGILPYLFKTVGEFSEKKKKAVVIKQMKPIPSYDPASFGVVEQDHWITTQVDLTGGHEQLWKNLKNNAQGPVKQSRKKGVIIKSADSLEDLKQFYDIFFIARKKIGIPVFPYRFFQEIWKEFYGSKKAVLFLALLDGKPVAGIFLLTHGETVIDGYAASIDDYRDYRVNDLLVWESICWACDNGYKVFDFGADSPLQQSLLAFKSKWKGKQVDVRYYLAGAQRNSPPVGDSSDPRYSIYRKVMSQLPNYLYRNVSSFIISGLG